MLQIEYLNRKINTLRIDRVVLRERTVVETDNYAYTAGEVLGGHKVVYLKNNKLYLASNTNLECLNKIVGITKNSAIENGEVMLSKSNIISLNGWGLVPNSLYYLGANGAITNVQPTIGIVQIIGIAKNENELEIKFNLPIVRN